jgi:hypothetical protein
LASIISSIPVRADSQVSQLIDEFIAGRIKMLEATLALGTILNVAGDRFPTGASHPANREFAEQVLIGTGVFRHGHSPEDSGAATAPTTKDIADSRG